MHSTTAGPRLGGTLSGLVPVELPPHESTPAGERRRWARISHEFSCLRLVREPVPGLLEAERAAAPIRSPRDVYQLLSPVAEREVTEVFWVLPLSAQYRVTAPIVVTRGVLNSTLVHPREVYRAAIVAGAAAVILCHNHPSGDPTPSADDRAVTDQLVAAGRLLHLPVHDHVIIGAGRYVSFAEAGLL